MLFCQNCEMMLYLKNDDLKYHCRNCGTESESKIQKVVYQKEYKHDDLIQRYLNNPYLINDPTLPRLKNVKCINDKCPSNSNDEETKKDSEIIYIKYNPENMKYLYMCVHCNASWKNK